MKKIYLLFIAIICTHASTNAQNWMQVGSSILGEGTNNNSGWAVSMNDDGTTVAIGAKLNSDTSPTSGQVRVYNWNGVNWIQKGNDINGQSTNDNSGWAVGISDDGNTIAIGSPNNIDMGNYAGQVRVYNWNGSSWNQKGIDIEGDFGFEYLGKSVCLSADGNIVAIGVGGHNLSAGQIKVYNWDGSAWNLMGAGMDGEADNDFFALYSVSLSNDGLTVASGAYGNDGGGSGSGHTRVYSWNGSAWVQKGIDIDGVANQLSGYAVDLNGDGTRVAIGCPLNTLGSQGGSVMVYDWNGSTWVLLGNEIQGTNSGDWFGNSVSLNDAGTIMVVGSAYYGASNIGQVQSFEWTGTIWQILGNPLDGSFTDDSFGYAVASSADGRIMIAGSPFNDENGSQSGKAQIYCYPSYTNITASHCDSVISPSGLYTWSSTGTYQDTLTSIFGCDSILTFNLTFIEIDTTSSIANGIFTSNQAGATYQWFTCPGGIILAGETGQSFMPDTNGTYAVAITLNGCVDTSACYTINDVSMKEFQQIENTVTVFPNPIENELNLQSANFISTIKIYDASGKLICSFYDLMTKSWSTNISSLQSGIYFLEITDINNQKNNLKIVKK